MLYSGKGSSCLNDLWTSTTGASWTQVTDITTSDSSAVPQAANAPSAVDANGCVWLLGGECNSYAGTIWKTCDAGKTWTPMPAPLVLAFDTPATDFPTSWSGHAITIVGGWQLVIVQASDDGGVWRYKAPASSTDGGSVQKVAHGPLPMGNRLDPKLLSTSDSKLYFVGGHACSSATCSDNMVYMDVWMSVDIGQTWSCQTSGLFSTPDLSALVTPYSKGISLRHSAVALTGDDTIYVMGGHKPNTTEGFNTIYTSFWAPAEAQFSSTPYVEAPQTASTGILKSMSEVALFFRENIQLGTGTIALVTGQTTVGTTTSLNGQGFYISPNADLTANTVYTLQMPQGSLKDVAGNSLPAAVSHTFTTHDDTTVPTISGCYPANGQTNVAPATTFRFTMSEAVLPGTGVVTLKAAVGTDQTMDISTATIRSTNARHEVVFPASSLTLGAVYTVQVPAGLLKDLRGNSIAADTSNSFTVLSGTASDTSTYTASHFVAGEPGTGNATLDTTAPTFVSMFPKVGATNVPAISGIAVVMYFSEQVKFNTSGVISIKNSSGHVVGTVNLTSDTSHYAISSVANATKVVMPDAVLIKGQKFTVSVPAGVIKDFAGNAAAAIANTFTCLSETADQTAPIVTALSLRPPSFYSASRTNMIDVFFSGVITAGSGTISVTGGSAPDAVAIATPISHANVTISGAKLTLSVYQGAMNGVANADTTYAVSITSAAVKDASGNLFLGLNGTSMSYTIGNLDTTAPTLSSKVPAHEASLTFGLPVTTSIVLTFSESVQVAQGAETAATFTPTMGYVTLDVPTSAIYIDQTRVVLAGGVFAPGEVYGVTVGANTFADLAGNAYAGLAAGSYTISTVSLMKFTQAATGLWGGIDYFTGERYGSCAMVDSSNTLYIAVGYNGTALGSSTMLNDVWNYASMRESTCAASFMPWSCTATTCVDSSKLEDVTVKRTVWRAPTSSGAPCIGSGSMDVRDMWAEVGTTTDSCPCPSCLAPPAGDLPKYMVNQSYVSAYTLVSAAPGTAPLLCRSGKVATGDFTCVVDTQYVGKYQTPYPTCEPAPCTSPPSTGDIDKACALSAAGSTGDINCASLNSTYTLASGGRCAFTC